MTYAEFVENYDGFMEFCNVCVGVMAIFVTMLFVFGMAAKSVGRDKDLQSESGEEVKIDEASGV